jgi:hypothetical protein
MNIESKAQSNIVGYISEKNIMECLKPFPKSGEFSVELEYDLAFHKNVSDKVYVRSVKITYVNNSMDGRTYKVYAFDAKSGKYLGEEKVNAKFVNELIVIKPIVC